MSTSLISISGEHQMPFQIKTLPPISSSSSPSPPSPHFKINSNQNYKTIKMAAAMTNRTPTRDIVAHPTFPNVTSFDPQHT